MQCIYFNTKGNPARMLQLLVKGEYVMIKE